VLYVNARVLLECADLSALWSLATRRQQRRDRSRRTKAVTGHRTPKGLPRGGTDLIACDML
jgi:hypothetical protein